MVNYFSELLLKKDVYLAGCVETHEFFICSSYPFFLRSGLSHCLFTTQVYIQSWRIFPYNIFRSWDKLRISAFFFVCLTICEFPLCQIQYEFRREVESKNRVDNNISTVAWLVAAKLPN